MGDGGNRQEKLWATTQTVAAARILGVAVARAESLHHSASQSKQKAGTGEEGRGRDMKFTAQLRVKPLPQAAGTQYHSLHDEEAPAAERPAPVEEVQPPDRHVRHGRHCRLRAGPRYRCAVGEGGGRAVGRVPAENSHGSST